MRDSDQLRLLKIFKTSFKAEYDAFPRGRTGDGQLFHLNNGWFEKVDAEMFEIVWSSYHMLRSHPDELDAAFDSFSVDITPPGTFLPGSFWIRRKGG